MWIFFLCDLCLWLCVCICLCDWQAHDTSSSVFLFLPILCRCWTYPIIWPLTFPIIWPLTFLIICHISSFKVRKKKVWILFTNSRKGVQFKKKPMTKTKKTLCHKTGEVLNICWFVYYVNICTLWLICYVKRPLFVHFR